MIIVQPGVSPADAVLSSPVIHNGSFAASSRGVSSAAGGGAADFDVYGGIDPTMDPELAMAIRVSAEEARASEEARVRHLQEQVCAQMSFVHEVRLFLLLFCLQYKFKDI